MVDDFFAEAVRKAVEDRVGLETVIIPVTKNNGLRLTSLTVKQEERKIEPTIYLENIPEDKRKIENVNDIADKIVGIFEEHQNDSEMEKTVENTNNGLKRPVARTFEATATLK